LSNQIKLHCLTTVMKQVHTTYINHARWHRCLRLCGLPVSLVEYSFFVDSVDRFKCQCLWQHIQIDMHSKMSF